MGDKPSRVFARAPVPPSPAERFFLFPWGWTGALGFLVTLLAGCGPPTSGREPPVQVAADTVRDDAGRAVWLAAPAHRVVSLLPSITDVFLALRATDRLVARTGFDRDTSLAGLPSFGRVLDPSVESVVALHPDLVFVGREVGDNRLTRVLESVGVPTYQADIQNLASIYATIDNVGRLVGLSPRAHTLDARIEEDLDEVRAERPAGDPPTVLFLVWVDPIFTTGRGTFVDELITLAGGRNVFSDIQVPWPAVSLEDVVQRDPDYIIVPRGDGPSIDPDQLRRLPGWRGLSAVRRNRLLVVDAGVFYHPGPRVAEAARTIALALRGQGR